jgi:hypothetical protein
VPCIEAQLPLSLTHHQVSFEDEHVANSPYDVRVDAGAYARNTLIESYSFVVRTKTRENQNKEVGGQSSRVPACVALLPGVWLFSHYFFSPPLHLRTGESKNFSVTIDGPGQVVADLEDLNDGAYRVSYSLPNRGRFTVNVKLNGEHIQGSPFTQRYGC